MSSSFHLPNGNPKTVIVTGGAGGIGAQTIRSYHSAGCNVVLADLPFAKDAAEELITALPEPKRAMFYPTNIINWEDMRALFRETKERFGQIDVVVANAGLMESKGFFDFEEDEKGELKEPVESYKVVDVNLKGTMNSRCIRFQDDNVTITKEQQHCGWLCIPWHPTHRTWTVQEDQLSS
jgi:NAD(P)-dependent dehydrogenase (short-subunit alcohol dehydrogenase family)